MLGDVASKEPLDRPRLVDADAGPDDREEGGDGGENPHHRANRCADRDSIDGVFRRFNFLLCLFHGYIDVPLGFGAGVIDASA